MKCSSTGNTSGSFSRTDYVYNRRRSAEEELVMSTDFLAEQGTMTRKTQRTKRVECLIPEKDLQVTEDPCKQIVSLEKVFCSGLILSGTVRVKNVGYEKRVWVKYTTDNWKSSHEVAAEFTPLPMWKSADWDSNDRFTFRLHIPNDIQVGNIVQFAVGYHVNGWEVWDNNMGKNYTLKVFEDLISIPS